MLLKLYDIKKKLFLTFYFSDKEEWRENLKRNLSSLQQVSFAENAWK